MELKYGTISDSAMKAYLIQILNGIFKILPLKEENSDTLKEYIESLQRELFGLNYLREDPKYMKVISTLEYLAQEDYSHATCKREVFKCIHIIQGICDQYQDEECKEGGEHEQ